MPMPLTRFAVWILMISFWASASSQNYPNKTIRIITSEAGGGTDFTARLIAQRLTAGLGQQVVVDNRVTVIGQEIAVKAPPDGYTLLVSSNSIWVAPLLQEMRYDPVRDFAPITLATSSPTVLVVNPKATEVRERLVNAGVNVIASSPNELTLAMKSEMTRIGQIIKAGGMTGE